MSNIIDKIQLSGVTYDIGGSGGGTVSSAITSGDTNAVAGGAVYDKFDEVEQVTAAALNDINDRVSEDEEVTAAALNTLNEELSGKQDTLISGTNIKTINNESLLGSGNIDIQGGGGGKAIEAGRGITVTSGETADTVSINLPISAGTGENSVIGNISQNTASGKNSLAFGGFYNSQYSFGLSVASGLGSVSFGGTASGEQSFAAGSMNCTASGQRSVTIAGYSNKSKGIESLTSGRYVNAENHWECSLGYANVSTKTNNTWGDSGNTLFSVGNGTSSSNRHNAFEIRQNGDIYISSGGTDIKLQDNLGGGSSYSAGTGIDITNDVISVTGKVDTSTYNTYTAATDSRLAEDEEVTAAALNALNTNKQDTLSAGTGISIIDNVISATGGGGGGTVESAITSGSTNAVESKAIWSATTYNKEVTLQWDNGFPSKFSTNYPSGCKKFVVTVLSNSNTLLHLFNGGSQLSGYININNYSSLSVSIDTFEGITYTISGNDVTFVVPDTIIFDSLYCDIRSITSIKAIVEGAWIADNTYMKSEVDTIQNTLQNNINQKLDSTAYTPVNVDSALIESSTNPVEGGVLYDELVYKGAASETTLTFEGAYSTNYPEGCTKLKVEVVGSMNNSSITFMNDWDNLGTININNYYGISVDNNFQGATYEISGTTVIISYPTVTNVTRINVNNNGNYVFKAVTYGASTTVKDALGGLKFVKLTQTEYDNLQTKDNSTLYVIVG